jgi:hypothetical protein
MITQRQPSRTYLSGHRLRADDTVSGMQRVHRRLTLPLGLLFALVMISCDSTPSQAPDATVEADAAADLGPRDADPSDAPQAVDTAPPSPVADSYALDPLSLLVKSDGTRSLGDPSQPLNDTRDQGSKIVYVDLVKGDNTSAEVYWWDGSQIVDSKGQPKNAAGLAYGKDPLDPNLAAIKPFAKLVGLDTDPRVVTQQGKTVPAWIGKDSDRAWRFAGLAGHYPDWFLLRRGQTHTEFGKRFAGGRSETEPMVVAAYGPLAEGRAIIDPASNNPFSGHNWGQPKASMHQALYSLVLRSGYGYLGTHTAESIGGGPVTAYLEDCLFPSRKDGIVVYPPVKTTFRRCVITGAWNPDHHNQGYYTAGFDNATTFDEVIFYKNGYKTDPVTDPDPRRDIYSRNIYQGGGAKLGHTYRNMISADGASGGPQMRLGGTMENSLVIEGYWFSGTHSNSPKNSWLLADGLKGSSALVRNNVQLVFAYPTAVDPDTHGASDSRAQPGWGYALQGASFGATIEGNIISGAMIADELGAPNKAIRGFKLGLGSHDYGGGPVAQADNVLQNNIAYRVKVGLSIGGDATGVAKLQVKNNVFAATKAVSSDATNLDKQSQLLVDNNRFYSDETPAAAPWLGANNVQKKLAEAAATEGWPDPDRTLKRYVVEELGLTLLDWSDAKTLDPAEVKLRADAKELYDPTGLKTFMAVATRMRLGGATPVPTSGKPDPAADYPWDRRFTAIAVVNWIRAGFGLPAVK